ncbi:MAG: hypothetical protein ABH834_05765, partial [Candidatus Altiarchaeota archaeon]
YEIDKEKQGRGALVGEAEFKGGETSVKTEDEKLRKLLTTPYTTLGDGEITEKLIVDKTVTYQLNDKRFLEVFAMECWMFGYLSEIED